MTKQGYQKYTPESSDSRFPSFLQGFNKRWFADGCKAIYVCFDADGTAAALEDAIQQYGKNVKIKSGGHCYEDFVFNTQTQAILDVTPMGDAGYDAERGYYLGSGGTNWTAFQALFRDYGKVLPAGSCYSVGLGGHICGGGYGLLSRLNGLTVDWLTGVEVVVKDDPEKPARVIYVSKDASTDDERSLFWAHCGGGGGNFGVIAKYYFQELPDAPPQALITKIAFNWSDLNADNLFLLLQWFAAFAARKDNWRQFGLFALNHQVTGEIHLTIQTAVLETEAHHGIYQQFVAPVLTEIAQIAPHQVMKTSGIAHLGNIFHHDEPTKLYTIYQAVQTLNGSGANQRGKYKSAYLRKGFPKEQVVAVWNALTTIPDDLTSADMMQCLLQADTYGGKINDVAVDATAIPQRSSILKLQYQAYWTDRGKDDLMLGWIRQFYQSVYAATGGVPDPAQDPTDNVDGCYYNYPDVDLNGPQHDKNMALQLYFGSNLPRLRKVKGRWDPEGYFNSAQSI